MLISELPNATPQKTDKIELQRGLTSSNNTEIGQLMQLSASENLAPAYDANAGVYAVGDFVSYNGTLYQCNTAIATPEAFDATKWDAVKVTEISSGASVVQLTQAEYTELSTAEKMNGSIYKITDNAKMYCLDEEYHAVKELTTAEYEALTTAQKNNGTLYIITDEETTAADIPYASGVSVADKIDSLSDANIQAVKGSYSGIKGVYGGYISGSKNYFDFFIPCNTNGLTTITNVSFNSISVLTANGRSDNPFSSYSVNVTPMGLFVDCRYSSTQAASISGVVTFDGMAFTAN